jgi:hypothetical protein
MKICDVSKTVLWPTWQELAWLFLFVVCFRTGQFIISDVPWPPFSPDVTAFDFSLGT